MKRYMIVDDSAVVRLVASRILAGPEHYVREAACGRQALEISSADMPEVMIVNWTLPDMTALDLIAELRAMCGQSELPRIAVWLVEPDVGAIMRAKRAGAAGYLLKPFTRNLLLEGIRRIEAGTAHASRAAAESDSRSNGYTLS